MKWVKRIGVALGVLLVVVGALPFFLTLNDYIPQIEKEASARLEEPVSITSISFAALPLPHLTIDGITVGKTSDIKVGKVTIAPAFLSLLSSTKVIRSVEIKSLVLTQNGLNKIPVWTKANDKSAQHPPLVRIESIRLDDALVTFEKASFGPFDARVNLNAGGELETASISTQDGKLKVSVKPEKSNYLIDAAAKSWTLPGGPPITFDELMVKGIATVSGADLSQVKAKLHGGSVNGKASVSWQKGFQLKGNFDVNQVELKSLAPLLSPGAKLSGKLTAKPVFSAAAPDANQLMNALRLEAPFSVQNGVLHGVDITQAATSLIKQGATGGETRFDELSGHLNMERRALRFTQLKIASGVLAADGNLNISPKKDLSGRINAQVKALGTSANVPLNVAGTVNSPLLYPTAASIAGAAVGTVILGPGLGTSVGAKVGGWAEDLFGKKEEKKARK